MNVENQNKVKQHNQNDNVKPNFQEFDQKKPYCQEKYKHSNITQLQFRRQT